jgi:hypothetical protein
LVAGHCDQSDLPGRYEDPLRQALLHRYRLRRQSSVVQGRGRRAGSLRGSLYGHHERCDWFILGSESSPHGPGEHINYRVEVNDNSGWKLVYTQVHFTGSPFDFDAYVPNVGTVTSGTSVDDLTVGTLHVTACVGAGCGSGGTSASFVDNETPTGTINSVNATFAIAQAPVPTASLVLTRNGIVLFQSVDYTLSGTSITFLSGAIPVTGDALRASYRIGGSSSNFVDFETPTGTINGVNLTFTLAHSPVTGSLSLMRNGVVLVATVDYSLSGSSITFTSGAQPLTGDSLYANYRY